MYPLMISSLCNRLSGFNFSTDYKRKLLYLTTLIITSCTKFIVTAGVCRYSNLLRVWDHKFQLYLFQLVLRVYSPQ